MDALEDPFTPSEVMRTTTHFLRKIDHSAIPFSTAPPHALQGQQKRLTANCADIHTRNILPSSNLLLHIAATALELLNFHTCNSPGVIDALKNRQCRAKLINDFR